MHLQRITLVSLSILGMGLSFLPWGKQPLLGPLNSTGLFQLAGVLLGVVALILSFVGSLKRAISGTVAAFAFLSVLLVFAAGVTRIMLVGYYWIPKFAEDDPRAKDFYERACAAGKMKACVLLGTCYWTGTCGQDKDVGRALELYERACDSSEISACGQLGVCYEIGGCGVSRNTAKAIASYEKACAGGEMDMCNNLGVCYHKGGCGVGRDTTKARQLYGKASDGGYSGACHNLTLLAEGR